MTVEQYWLGITKPKKAFRSTQNAFNVLLQNFKKKLLNGIFYWLTDKLTACLMASYQRNLTMAESMCLLFDVASAQEVPSSWSNQCPHSFLLTVKSVNSVVARDGFLFITEKFPYLSYWELWLHSCFSNTSRFILGGNRLATNHNAYLW